MKSFFDRLQTVMFVKKMNQDELSSITGIDSGTISRWKTQGTRPRDASIKKICTAVGCKFDWLKNGTGAMVEDADRSDCFGRVNSGRPLEVPRSRGQESHDQDFSIEEMLSDTRTVLESDTVYRQALASNIRAFKQAVINEGKMKNTDEKIDQMMKQIEALTAIVLQGQSGSHEKKRAGNDL